MNNADLQRSNPELESITTGIDPNVTGDTPIIKKKPRQQLWIIIVIVALNSIGMSVVLPLLPFIVGKYLPSQQVVVGMSMLMSVFSACTFLQRLF